MKNKELFDRANADGDKELQAKLRNDFADGANAAARVKKPRAPKMTCDEMLQNLKSIAKGRDRQ